MSVTTARRAALRIDGVVQGVGFRPFVFRLAEELGLAGFVRNDARGVLVEVEGPPPAVARFVADVAGRAPPLARVERVEVHDTEPAGGRGFAILASDGAGAAEALVSPDTATCPDCLAELRDPADRRYRYPFINCTSCGPRFTIVRAVPYDRPATTMAGFAMCAACRAEYEDPRHRRFHAQPNACPDCGPRARLLGPGPAGAQDAVAAAAALLRAGAIVAVKGLGGYHLACRAADPEAVAALRARKHREDKPFALMAADVAAVRALVELDAPAEAMLRGRDRPIVLAPRRRGARVAPAVAPGLRELGVMLPYTPLHHLLLADVGEPVVLTSGNVSDEPIAYRDADARRRLAPIADAFLVHDRPIHVRVDDGVVRAAAGSGRAMVLRRSRGRVPDSVALPVPCPAPLLACGAQLKSTFCVAKGRRAWLGPHVGDLDEPETRRSYAEGVAHVERLFDVHPAIVAHDLHPDYASTAYAVDRARDGVRLVGVQHHHAHLAACLAEHGLGPDATAVGAIYDGAGLGDDGTIWGGEILMGSLRAARRLGHLHPVALPGGDRAARQPWRMACAWLVACAGGDGAAPAIPPAIAPHVAAAAWRAVAALARRGGLAAPVTTSMGRLFDAVAAICGLPLEVTYEGQAAVALEAVADGGARGAYDLPVDDALVLDARPAVCAAAADVARGAPAATVAMRFHRGVAVATGAACAAAAARGGTELVVLSGGVFQNALLLDLVLDDLRRRGLRALVPERVPPNDGGISFGQAAVAAARG